MQVRKTWQQNVVSCYDKFCYSYSYDSSWHNSEMPASRISIFVSVRTATSFGQWGRFSGEDDCVEVYAVSVECHRAREQRLRDTEHPEQKERSRLTDCVVGARRYVWADNDDQWISVAVQTCNSLQPIVSPWQRIGLLAASALHREYPAVLCFANVRFVKHTFFSKCFPCHSTTLEGSKRGLLR